MSNLLKLSFFLLLFRIDNAISGDVSFDSVDPNAAYNATIKKISDYSVIKNNDYLKVSIKQKVKIHTIDGLANKNSIDNTKNTTGTTIQKITGNSVLIGDGTIINGDIYVNLQVTGDTYVAGK